MPKEKFSWIPFYRELSEAVLKYRNKRDGLLEVIYKNPVFASQTTYLRMQDRTPAIDIDPFSFFGIFNRGIKADARKVILRELKIFFGLMSPLPEDFTGIPILNNQKSFYFQWNNPEITKSSCEELWRFFESVLSGNANGELFDKLVNRKGIGVAMLTIPMFWVRPDNFLPWDKLTKNFLENEYSVSCEIRNFSNYISFLKLLKTKMQNREILENTFFEISENAFQKKGFIEKQTKTEIKYANNLRRSKNLILTGAPGTGKTYLAREIAKAMGCGKNEIGFVQFHPSYDYTDFIEGLRPVQNIDGNVGFERRDGLFKEFCRKALLAKTLRTANVFEGLNDNPTVWKVSLEGTGENPTRTDCFENGWIRIGWSGYGDVENFDEFEDFTGNPTGKTILRTFQNGMKVGDIVMSCWSSQEIDAIGIITGDYEYRADGGHYPRYRSVKWIVKNIRENIVDFNGGKQMTLSTVYRLSMSIQDVQKIVEKHLRFSVPASEAKPFVFIIDEINRGEIAKIFGELFFSIDPGYRGEKGRVKTQYQNLVPAGDVFKDGFYVPENVYIIGTMNDIDRSVECMDFAMRRRFCWQEIKPEDRTEMLDAEIPRWKGEATGHMNVLNETIKNTPPLNAAYQIGPAYFLWLKNCDGDFDALWENHLAGTLKEYLRGVSDAATILQTLKDAYDSADAR